MRIMRETKRITCFFPYLTLIASTISISELLNEHYAIAICIPKSIDILVDQRSKCASPIASANTSSDKISQRIHRLIFHLSLLPSFLPPSFFPLSSFLRPLSLIFLPFDKNVIVNTYRGTVVDILVSFPSIELSNFSL